MKLLTIFELAAKPDSELRALYREAFNAAARSDRTSEERAMFLRRCRTSDA